MGVPVPKRMKSIRGATRSKLSGWLLIPGNTRYGSVRKRRKRRTNMDGPRAFHLNDAGARRTDSNVCHVSSTSGMGALTMHHVGSQEPKHFVLGAFYSETPGSDGHE